MANKSRGEVAFEAGGKTYTLRLSVNAIAEIEDLLGGLGIAEITASLAKSPKLGTLRALVWGGLRQHHPDLSLFDAGDIIGDVGVTRTSEIIGESLAAAFPEATEGDNHPSPATTQAGTG